MIMEGLLAQLKGIAASSQKLARRVTAYRTLAADPVKNAYSREKALAGLSKLVAGFPDSEVRGALGRWLESERAAVEKDKEEFRFGFGSRLAESLEKVGLRVSGQLPVLRVGMFSVRVDFGAGKAVLFWGPEVERLETISRLEPESIAGTLAEWKKSLAERASEPAKLARRLAEAYERVCGFGGLVPGTRVPLIDVLAEIVLAVQPRSFRANPSRGNFAEYPRVRFSYDLYRLKASGIGHRDSGIEDGEWGIGNGESGPGPRAPDTGPRVPYPRLHVATFDATTDKTKALWVPDNEGGEGTHYSYVSVSG